MSDLERQRMEERFEEEKEGLFEEYITQSKVTDTEIVNFILTEPELYTLLVDKWMNKPELRNKLWDWFESNQPDGPEDEDR